MGLRLVLYLSGFEYDGFTLHLVPAREGQSV